MTEVQKPRIRYIRRSLPLLRGVLVTRELRLALEYRLAVARLRRVALRRGEVALRRLRKARVALVSAVHHHHLRSACRWGTVAAALDDGGGVRAPAAAEVTATTQGDADQDPHPEVGQHHRGHDARV